LVVLVLIAVIVTPVPEVANLINATTEIAPTTTDSLSTTTTAVTTATMIAAAETQITTTEAEVPGGDIDDLVRRWQAGDSSAVEQIEVVFPYYGSKKESLGFFKKYSDAGFAPAQTALAGWYAEYESDSSLKGADLYRKAAMQNYAPAEYKLATYLRNGQGVAQDFEEAKKWYEDVIHNHSKDLWWVYYSSGALAQMSEKGEGGRRDVSAAIQWYERANQLRKRLGMNDLDGIESSLVRLRREHH